MRTLFFTILFLAPALFVQAQTTMPDAVKKVSDKYACGSCHQLDKRLVGPSWRELAKKKYSAKTMFKLIRTPQPGNWPNYPPMAPIPNITSGEVKVIADWLSKLN